MIKKSSIRSFLLLAALTATVFAASGSVCAAAEEWSTWTTADVAIADTALISSLRLDLPTTAAVERSLRIPDAYSEMLDDVAAGGDRPTPAMTVLDAAARAAAQSLQAAPAAADAGVVALQPFERVRLLLQAAAQRRADGTDEGMVAAAMNHDELPFAPSVLAWNSSQDFEDAPERNSLDLDRLMHNPETTAGRAPGSQGVALGLRNISLLPQLSHNVSVALFTGAAFAEAGAAAELTPDEYAWKVNVDHTYRVFEGLAAMVEMSYMDGELDKKLRDEKQTLEAWKLAFGMAYRF